MVNGLDLFGEEEQKLILGMARRYARIGKSFPVFDTDDLIQAGVVGLLAARRAGKTHIGDFSHYVRREIAGLIMTAPPATGRKRFTHGVLSAVAVRETEDYSLDESIPSREEREPTNAAARVDVLLMALPPKSAAALVSFYGLQGSIRNPAAMRSARRAVGVAINRVFGGRPKQKRDMAGKKVGNLLVLRRHGGDGRGHPMWLCRCDCGAECVRRAGDLTTLDAVRCSRTCPTRRKDWKLEAAS